MFNLTDPDTSKSALNHDFSFHLLHLPPFLLYTSHSTFFQNKWTLVSSVHETVSKWSNIGPSSPTQSSFTPLIPNQVLSLVTSNPNNG